MKSKSRSYKSLFWIVLFILCSLSTGALANVAYWTDVSGNKVSKQTVNKGETIHLFLKAEIPANKSLQAYDLTIEYDHTLFPQDKVTAVAPSGSSFPPNFINKDTTPGEIYLVGFSAFGVQGSATVSLLDLTLTAGTTCDTSSLTIRVTDFGSSTESFPPEPQHAEIEIGSIYYRDADGDGYGDPGETCTGSTQPSGYVPTAGDCNDQDKAMYPGAAEICDNKDNNCDGRKDEGLVQSTYYHDADHDGYGNCNETITACTQPDGYVSTSTCDCEDSDADIKPGATEVCDCKDNDCDGSLDPEGCPSLCEIRIKSIKVSNISSASATITWFTDMATSGEVHYSHALDLSNPLSSQDTLGSSYSGFSHSVKITGLTPETTYYFEVKSGDSLDNNQGAYYSFTTCGQSMGVSPHTLTGEGYLEDEVTPAEGVIVFVTISRGEVKSHPLSCRVGSDGKWSVELRNLKNAADCKDFYWQPGDIIGIEGKGRSIEDGDLSARWQGSIDSTNPQNCRPPLIFRSIVPFTLSLKRGYNLISLPFGALVDEDGQEMSLDSYSLLENIEGSTTVTSWEPDEQFYYTAYQDTTGQYGERFEILSGRAYFVSVNQSVNVTFSGRVCESPETLDLRSGYNFISCTYGTNMPEDYYTGYSSYTLLTDIPDCVTATSWNPDDQFYYTAYLSADEQEPSGSLFPISVGQGFIVLVDKATSWTPQANGGGSAQYFQTGPSRERTRHKSLEGSNPAISNVMVSNISAATATISWFTDCDAPGLVFYSEDPSFIDPIAAYDEKGSDYSGISHSVKISGLKPLTSYYFVTQSGNTYDNNSGTYFSFITCDLSMGAPRLTLQGKIYQADRVTPAEGAIVYITISRDAGESSEALQSYPLSSRVGSNARWEVELGNLKEANSGKDFIWKPGNEITITVRSGIDKEITDVAYIASEKLPQGCGQISIPCDEDTPKYIEDPSPYQGTIFSWPPSFLSVYQQSLWPYRYYRPLCGQLLVRQTTFPEDLFWSLGSPLFSAPWYSYSPCWSYTDPMHYMPGNFWPSQSWSLLDLILPYGW